MPNRNNIKSPLILIAPGRSGTSLLSNMFKLHPDVSFSGETANLIFDVWNAVEFAEPELAELFIDGKWVSCVERAGMAVREVFLNTLPDDKAYWMQKPIGVPKHLMNNFHDMGEWEDAAVKYWRVMKHSFPEAKFFTVLRHPCDVVISSKAYWGYDENTLWTVLGLLSHLLTHKTSLIEHAVSYEALVDRPEENVRALFSFAGIPFHEDVMGAFKVRHVPSEKPKGSGSGNTFSRKEEWEKLDASCAKPEFTAPIEALYRRFNVDLTWPDHFDAVSRPGKRSRKRHAAAGKAPGQATPEQPAPVQAPAPETPAAAPGAAASTPADEAEEWKSKYYAIHCKIEKIHSDYTAKIRERVRIQFNKRKELQKLHESSTAWFKEQLDNWRVTVEKKDAEIDELKKWIEGLTNGRQWLTETNAKLEDMIRSRDAAIAELRGWNAELEKGRKWADERIAAAKAEAEKAAAWSTKQKESNQWLERQLANWKKLAEEREATIAELRRKIAAVKA